jgi:cytochrome c biogenesis protein CcdA
MDEIALALAAGLVAAFNPCGFALLPSYLALLVATPGATASGKAPGGTDRAPVDGVSGMWRALRLSLAMTVGFVAVFGVFGLAASVLTVSIQAYLPWVTIVVGVLLTALGGWLLSGRELSLRLPRVAMGDRSGSLAGIVGYGISYAVASLSCTIGPFLAVTGLVSSGPGGPGGLSAAGVLDGVAAFVAYAVGMGLVVGLLSMMVALAHGAAVARMRRLLPHVSRASGGLLLLAGAYIAHYGWYEVRVNAGAVADDPIVGYATGLQGMLTGWLDGLGITWVAAGFAVVIIGALLARGRAAGRSRNATHRDGNGTRRAEDAAGRGEHPADQGEDAARRGEDAAGLRTEGQDAGTDAGTAG